MYIYLIFREGGVSHEKAWQKSKEKCWFFADVYLLQLYELRMHGTCRLFIFQVHEQETAERLRKSGKGCYVKLR